MMVDFAKRNHLRLVEKYVPADNATDETLSRTPIPNSPSGQVRFFFVRETDILHNRAFLKLIEEISPDSIFDVRITPRLDFLAPNRSLAFQIFDEMKIEYIDIIGSIGAESYSDDLTQPEHWVHHVTSFILGNSTCLRTCLFVFDNENILKRAENVIATTVKRTLNSSTCEIVDLSTPALIAM